jgi:putative DNA primase/helicase
MNTFEDESIPTATTLNTHETDPDGHAPSPQRRPRYERIARWMRSLVEPGSVVELRAPEVTCGDGYRCCFAGYFDDEHLLDLAIAADTLTGQAAGVYFTLNPVEPELLAHYKNRVEKRPKKTTRDGDIVRRTRLLVDLDPKRYSGSTGRELTGDLSATDEEKARARATAERVITDLSAAGWPEPVFADSGNGYYVIYKIDLSTDDGGLVERCLKALAARYDDEHVSIDPRVHNPSRICKVVGTWARKGDDTPERPHRRSRILGLPRRFEPVPTALLEALGGPAPVSKPVGKYDPVVARSQQAAGTRSGSIADRARAYLKELPPSVSGQGGHKALFRAAMVLADSFGLDHDTAMPLFREYNERPDGDPESDQQLEHKLADALAKVEEAGGPSRDLLGPARDEETGGEGDHLADDPAGLNVPVNNPKRLAEVTLAQRFAHPEARTLHHWGGAWWAWRDAAYALVEPDALEDVLTRVAEDEFERDHRDKLAAYHARIAREAAEAQQGGGKPPPPEPPPQLLPVTRALVANVLGALRAHVRLETVTAQPAWLGTEAAPFPPGGVLPTRSALVHLETGRSVPPTPRFFAPYALEFDYEPDAPAPAEWLKFLATVWGTDTAAIETLQEWFGYCLTPDTSQHKILLLVGPPRSGKGTLARVLRRLIGVENTVGPTLASLAESFGLEPLIGKPLAIIGDARLSARSDRSVVTERLLSLSGEDTLSCNRKNTSYWTGQLPTRLVLLTNETPWLTDSSRALAGRFLVLHMTESFAGREDRALEARLAAELPSTLNWAIAGWKRLRARGTFVQPESGRPLVEELTELSSRITTFLADACEIDPSYQEAIPHVYLAWCRWCDQQGESNPGSTRSLAKELRTVLPRLSSDKSTKRDGQSLKLFGGLRLNAEYRNFVRHQGHTPLTQPLNPEPTPPEGTPRGG